MLAAIIFFGCTGRSNATYNTTTATKSTQAVSQTSVAAASTSSDEEDPFNRTVLPVPELPFKGKIALRSSDSVKDFPKDVYAPKDAPNILLILTDDVGFGATSTFGGPIPTPTLDRLARAGLRFNRFT